MLRRSILDIGMGFIILGIGVFFLIASRLGVNFQISDDYKYFFASLCIIYGGWRMYRGYKKNYFN